MEGKRKITVILLGIMIIISLAVVISIVPKHNNDEKAFNLTTESTLNITMITTPTSNLSDTTMRTTYDNTLTHEPWAPVLILSGDTFSSWTIQGTIFIGSSTVDSSHFPTWHICSNGPSSISRSINFSTFQLDYIDEDYTELIFSYWSRGNIILNKFPNCMKQKFKVDSIYDLNENDNISWNQPTVHYTLCSKDDINVTIMFYNDIACIKDVKMTLWKVPLYESDSWEI